MDLDNLFKRAFDGFGEPLKPPRFPGVPGSSSTAGHGQTIDPTSISRCSRISRSGMGRIGAEENFGSGKTDLSVSEDRANVSPSKTPGNTGTPGNEVETPVDTTSLQFPVRDREPGTPGTDIGSCRHSTSDLNHLAPSPETPFPISPADVRAGVARELRALAEVGREGPEALRDAIEITQGKIRNSPALAERQANGSACCVCNAPLDDSLPEIAVLTAKRGLVLWMHAGCHGAYEVRRMTLVDQIMAEAGYGPGEWAETGA